MMEVILFSKRRPVSLDWAMKKLLKSKTNYSILEGFLSELLFEDMTIKDIVESEDNQRLIIVENSKGEIVVIEIKFISERDYFHWIYGTSKVIIERMEITESWSQVKKVISISIVYFDLGRGEDYIYHGNTTFTGIHKKDHLKLSPNQKKLFNKNFPEEIFPDYYVIKVNKFNDNAKDTLDQWIYFLKNEEIKDEFNAKGLKEAKDTLDIMNLPKEERVKYNKYIENRIHDLSEAQTIKQDLDFARTEGEKKGMEKGMEKGIEKGMEQEKIDTARKMKAKGFDSTIISELTGLSVEEIENL